MAAVCEARRLLGTFGLLGLLLTAGCVDPKKPVRVAGEISCDGAPLSNGTIVFTPEDGKAGPSVGGNIAEGRYSVPAEKGILPGVVYRVEITSLAASGKKIPNPFTPGGPELELSEQFLPAVYNTQSTLRITAARGTNHVDFRLEKEPK